LILNVGIGTTSPYGKLDVSGTSGGTLQLLDLENLATSPGAGSALNFSGASSVDYANITEILEGASNANAALTFGTRGAGVVGEHMRISGAGNVGIGTATPSANTKLEVVGAAASRANIIASGNSVDLSLSNVHVLQSVGSTTINLSNMTSGGSYTLIISDTTQQTYTFAGCTNTYFSPTNGQTFQQSTYSIMSVILPGAITNCYVNWVTGFN
jgi:hypothetical protein